MKNGAAQGNLRPQDRIIVALDVPTKDDALRIVEELDGVISFYKIGLELLMAGGMEDLLRYLVRERQVFVDLKLPGDIPETVKRVVRLATDIGVRFLTLSNEASRVVIQSARDGRGDKKKPELLFVSYLSSLDRKDFADETGRDLSEFEEYFQQKVALAKQAGVDGFIVSGQEIRLLRSKYPGVTLVSPGIRPSGSALDDHKRSCTPAEAIQLGADYIVVGRPIHKAPNRREAAQKIVDEVAGALGGSPAGAKASDRAREPLGGGYDAAHEPTAMLARSKD